MSVVEGYVGPRFREKLSGDQRIIQLKSLLNKDKTAAEPGSHEINQENKRLNNRTTRMGYNQLREKQNYGEDESSVKKGEIDIMYKGGYILR